jgi:phage shock protein PspC (stress-responsive transcriptional regulator)
MLTRILFAALTVFTGFGLGLCLYLAAWVILPDSQFMLPPSAMNT